MRWRAWLYRILPYLGRRQAEADLQKELPLHLELERERQLDAGIPESDAERAARRRLGNGTLIRERTRDLWGWRWLDDLARDLRHAARGLGRSPGFTATVVVVLALGIGANTAMFSVVYGMLIRPLPYPDAEALVRVGQACRGDSQWSGPGILSNVQMALVQEEAESFEQIAVYLDSSVEWASRDGAVTLRGAAVSPALFPLLRARPHLGRLFTEGEARLGAHRVVLLSHGAWIRRFGSDPDIVGKALEFAHDLDAGPHTVVGVLAEGFYFPSATTEVWTPFAIPTNGPADPDRPRFKVTISAAALGRLAPGVSPEKAATEVHTLLQRSDTNIFCDRVDGRARSAAETPEIVTRVIPLREAMAGEYRPALLALTAAMALVLLIACTNVAGLLLARGVARRRALAVCAALGAGRGRIVRQLLTESVVLSVLGGAMGLVAAAVVLRVVPALVPGDVARLDEVGVDGVVLAFTLGLSLVVGLAFGAVPAFQWPRLPLVRVLNEGIAQSTGGFRLLRSSRTRAALATAQVALALVLVIGAGLFLRSFVGLLTIDRGYDAANVIAARPSNPASPRLYEWMPERGDGFLAANRRFSEALLRSTDRLERLPGVAAVGLSSSLPLAFPGMYLALVHPAGRAAPSNLDELPLTWLQLVSPGYFDVMRLRLRGGRFFTRLDGAGSPPVVVVNETLARKMFGGEPAVGQGLIINAGDAPWQVVGVVADVRYEGLAATGSRAEAFVSVHQPGAVSRIMSSSNLQFLAVRTTGDPLAVVPFLHEAVTEAHPRATIEDVVTMDARLSAAIAQPRFYAGFVGFFAALAMFLAAFGVYGLLSYTVAHRRREIGVRMALGAQRGDIVGLVVQQGAALVVAGAAAGLFAAFASSRVLQSLLYGVATDDLLTFVTARLVLVAAALVACWIPARRATQVDPIEVLRFE